MKKVLVVLGVIAFTIPFWLIGGMYLWVNVLGRGRAQAADLGMKLSSEKQLAMELGWFADAYFVPIAIVLVVFFWAVAAWLAYLALRRRSPEARG